MNHTQAAKAEHFRSLHERQAPWVMANCWDVGSALLLQKAGFEALATSSGASAAVLGKRDGALTRDEALAHCTAVCAATTVPVAADLENGFGDSPEACAETIRLAAAAGLVGGSIEDAGSDEKHSIYGFEASVARVAAAAEAARALPFPFTLTARAENFLRGRADLADTIARLQAYERAGADVLFAPALPDLDAVRQVCAALKKPFSYMVGIKGRSWPVADLAAAGVRRISLATSLYRLAMASVREAAAEIRERGTFGYVDRL